MRKLQIFILCLFFFFMFDSVALSKRYKFMDYGVSFFIPDVFSCEITKEDEGINIFCKYKEENIYFGLSKNNDPRLLKNLYNLKENDYDKAEQIIEIIENFFNGMKIKTYTIAPIFNINMFLSNCVFKVKTLHITLYRHCFLAIGLNNKSTVVSVAMNAKFDTDEKKAIKNFENFKKKYFKEVITGIVFY